MVAQYEARIWRQPEVGTENLLYGMILRESGLGFEVLRSHANVAALRRSLKQICSNGKLTSIMLGAHSKDIAFSKNARLAFVSAWDLASERLQMITTAHLLAAVCNLPGCGGSEVLAGFNLDLEHIAEMALYRAELSKSWPVLEASKLSKATQHLGLTRRDDGPEPTELPQHWIKPTLNLRAAALLRTREFTKAEQLFLKALELNPNTDRIAHATTLNGFGLVQLERGNFAKAETAFRQALETRREMQMEQEEPDEAGVVLNHLGLAVAWQGHYREARRYLQQGLDLMELGRRPDLEATIKNNMGDIYRALSDLDPAQEILFSEPWPNHPEPQYLMACHFYRARWHRDFGDKALATEEFCTALSIALTITQPAFMATAVAHEFADFLEKQGDSGKAKSVRASIDYSGA